MKLSDLHGKRVLLWGAGRETTSLVRNLERNAIDVDLLGTVVDRPADSLAERELGSRAPVLAPAAAHEQLAAADVIVRSPVIQPTRRELRAPRKRGATITTATALWIAEHGSVHVIGVTGSKGKTTTTTLIGHLLAEQGLNVEVAGNIGRPVTDIDPAADLDHVVLELSSFQLTELTRAPKIAVYTNFLREHDNWHRGTDSYLAAKLNMVRRPGVEHVVARAADPVFSEQSSTTTMHVYGEAGKYTIDDDTIVRDGSAVVALSDLQLNGPHNLLNVAAALTAVSVAGHEPARARELLESFEPPPNRLAFVAEREGVTWVDDVHSSAPESAVAAARAFDGPVALLVGGRLRGQDHGQLIEEMLARPGLVLFLFESGGAAIHDDALAAGVEPTRLHLRVTFSGALDLAGKLAKTPSTVVLSPIGLMEDPVTPILSRSAEFRAFVAERAGKTELTKIAAV